jgi:pimeloyl-ACP methyl ester carboxylesterase
MRQLLMFVLLSASLAASDTVVEGRKVHYSVTGAGPSALVLIHGWTCDSSYWSANVPDLAKHYRVLAVDLPGHGQSDPAPGYSMDSFADAVSAAMNAEHIGKAALVGHSMGGAILLAFARRHPEQATALVAVDGPMIDSATAERFEAFAKGFEGPDAMAIREKMIASLFSTATTPELKERIRKGMLATPAAVAAGAMLGMASPPFWHDDTIGLPFLEIAAANNTSMTLESLQRHFPKAELKRIDGTGHFLMMEKPAEFDQMLLDWLGAGQ